MPDILNTQHLHYVPIGVSGQIFAFPMSEVAAIRRLGDEETGSDYSADDAQTAIPIVDLRQLFFPVSRQSPGRPAYVAVITIPGLTYAVLVDDVRPARHAPLTDQLAVPHLLAMRRYPFSGVIREADALVLMIDTRLLADQLRQVKPDLIREQPHGR